MSKLGAIGRTSRGFEIIKFRDRYDVPCSLQMSSLADFEQPGISAVWIGTDTAQPKVMAREAAQVGVKTTETTGWVDYPIPDQVSLNTRAHMDRTQVKALIDHLQAWLENGSFEVPETAEG